MISRAIASVIDWWTTDDIWRELRRQTPSRIGLAMLRIAQEEVGNGEEGGNNQGRHVNRYRAGHGGDGAWCAALVSWCMEAACRELRIPCPIKRSHGARRLYRRVVKAGWKVDRQDLQPGDIVCWSRGRQAWQGHIGIVSKVHRDHRGLVTGWAYIAGNEGRYPAKVAEYAAKEARLIGFARMPTA